MIGFQEQQENGDNEEIHRRQHAGYNTCEERSPREPKSGTSQAWRCDDNSSGDLNTHTSDTTLYDPLRHIP